MARINDRSLMAIAFGLGHKVVKMKNRKFRKKSIKRATQLETCN